MRPAVSAILLLLAALACGPPAGVSSDPPRNLILVSLDTLRADHLSLYGYRRATSPRLDAFAAGGVVFRNAISSASWTVPAHMSLFTGLDPSAHGVLDFPEPGRLSASIPTLAEVLRSAGLRTAAFTGGGFLSDRHGFGAGFEVFDTRGRRLPGKLVRAKAWLESLGPHQPFFLFLHGFDVHRPYRPPGRFAEAFVPPDAAAVRERALPLAEDLARLVRDRPTGAPVVARPPAAELAWLIAQYDGEIAFVDSILGDFFAWLAAGGRLADTLVVVVSDHGDEFYEHGGIDHVRTLYDELLRVVWFMVGPGVPAARVVEEPVSLVDVLPTLLDVMKLPAPATIQGRSRLAALREVAAPAAADADAVVSFTGFSEYPYAAASIRSADWKLIRWSRAGTAERMAQPGRPPEWYAHLFVGDLDDRIELFDLARDPGEQHDVADVHPDVVARLKHTLDQRLAAGRALRRSSEPSRPPNAAETEALQALGYVE